MIKTRQFRPVNSIIFIDDDSDRDAPLLKRGSNIEAGIACIAVGCLMEQDGPTRFFLGESNLVDPGYPPALIKALPTPNYRIALTTAVREVILEMKVPKQETLVRIWTNDVREPDRILVGIG